MRLNNNQKHLMRSGGWWALYDGFTSLYLAAFALALGASNTIIGILGAIPYVAIMISEIPGAKLLEHFKRLQIYGFASMLSRFMWLGMILTPLLFAKNPLLAVVIFYFLSKLGDYVSDPAWTVLVADAVPNKIRGEFIARRVRLINIFGMIALVLGGWYLDLFQAPDLTGFVTMFLVGIGFGVTTTLFTLRVKEPPYQDHAHHGFREFFQLDGDLKRFTIFTFCFNFAFMLASPFFTVYILKDLGQPYAIFAIATALTHISKILVFKHVGKLSDKFGDKPVLLLSCFGTAIVPLLFLLISPERIWLLFPVQILTGIVWAGYDVTIFNMFLDVTTPDKRAVQTATYSIVTSIPLAVGPVLGGFIADNLVLGLAGIPLVFAISAVFRALAPVLLLKIPERRITHEYPLREVLWKAVELHPSRGLQHRWQGVIRGFRKRGMLFLDTFR